MDKVKLLHVSITTGGYSAFVRHIIQAAGERDSRYTCIMNVHMLVEAYKSKAFSEVIRRAAVVTPDGKPLCWALRLLHGIRQDRVAGMDLLPDLIRQAEAQRLPVYFYGGQPGMLERTSRYLQQHFPRLPVAGMYSPPFRPLSAEEDDAIVAAINGSGARMVMVVLGCPKQEKWMASMQGRINAMMIGVGGALPVMIGAQKRAPRWMQRAGMEWFHRLQQEPVRLFRRYAVTNSLFLYILTREYLRLKFSRKVTYSMD